MKFLLVIAILVVFAVLAVFVFNRKIEVPPAGTSDADIAKIAADGDMLRAIKWYRILHSVSFKEAKEAVAKISSETR